MNASDKQAIRDLLVRNELKNALKQMQSLTPESRPNQYNALILLLGQFREMEQKVQRGLLTQEEASVVRANITNRLLGILDEEEVNPLPPPIPKERICSQKLSIAMALTIILALCYSIYTHLDFNQAESGEENDETSHQNHTNTESSYCIQNQDMIQSILDNIADQYASDITPRTMANVRAERTGCDFEDGTYRISFVAKWSGEPCRIMCSMEAHRIHAVLLMDKHFEGRILEDVKTNDTVQKTFGYYRDWNGWEDDKFQEILYQTQSL